MCSYSCVKFVLVNDSLWQQFLCVCVFVYSVHWQCVQLHLFSVKHDARCVMGKVGGRQKPIRGNFNLLLEIHGKRLPASDNNGLNTSK